MGINKAFVICILKGGNRGEYLQVNMDINTSTDTALQSNEPSKREKIFKILNLSVPILMGIFIFFNPFSHTTSIKEICFYSSLFIVLLLIFFKKIDFSFKSPLTLPFVLFVIWAFIGLFFALDKGNSIHDFRAHLLKYLAVYYILINFFNSRKHFETLSWIIIISGGIFSIGGIIYFYIISGNPISSRMGFPDIASINNVGIINLFVFLLSLNHFTKESKLHGKVMLFVVLGGTSAGMLLTQTIGVILGIIFSLLILSVKNIKGVIIVSLFLVIVIGFLPVKNRLTPNAVKGKLLHDDRVCIWNAYFKIIKDRPIIGSGFGMQTYEKKLLSKYKQYRYKVADPIKFKTHVFFTPHNMFIDITVRLGFVGLALFIYTIFMFIYMCFRMIKYGQSDFIRKWALCLLAALVGYLTQAMFADILIGGQLIILYTIFAMMTVLWRLNTNFHTQNVNL